MRKFKHKITGNIAIETHSGYNYRVTNPQNFTIPKWIVENSSDWEEIKEELPVGIRIVDTQTNVIYTKNSEAKWDSLTWKENIIPTCMIEEGKRFQIVKEEVKKDFEILKFIKSNNIYNVLEDGNLLHDIPEYKNIKTNPSATHWTQAIEKGYNIHSVRRLSDNCIFQLGDKLNTGYIIESIYIDKEKQDFRFVASGKVILAKFAVKAKILFTTEDGKEIREGDEYYYVLEPINNYIIGKNNCTKFGISLNRKGIKYFSVKEAAEEYIILNKPCLSINDVAKIYKTANQFPVDRPNFQGNLLKELVKSKLK